MSKKIRPHREKNQVRTCVIILGVNSESVWYVTIHSGAFCLIHSRNSVTFKTPDRF